MKATSTSEQLRRRLEDEFNIIIPEAIHRIHGVKGAAYRWCCFDSNGNEYHSEDTMSECVKASHLSKFQENLPGMVFYISAENVKYEAAKRQEGE